MEFLICYRCLHVTKVNKLVDKYCKKRKKVIKSCAYPKCKGTTFIK